MTSYTNIATASKPKSVRWMGHLTRKREMRFNRKASEEEKTKGTTYVCLVSNKMNIKEISCYGLGWIQLTRGTVQWWAIVKMTMKLRAA